MGKFNQLLARSGDQILEGRAARVLKAAKNAAIAHIQTIENSIMKVEDEMEAMLDMSPDNRYSLKIGESFSGEEFITTYQAKALELHLLKQELKIAQDTNKDLFDEK
jgi:hypothetical protein